MKWKLLAAMAAALVIAPTAVAAQPYNLIVIQTDEHNFRTLGCYRETLAPDQAFVWGPNAVVETPHLDSIAARGAICTSFYVNSPVCTPSRAAFFSGRYPQNTNAWRNDRPYDSSVVTWAQVLSERGYASGYAGKWHLDGSGKPQWAPKRKFGFTDNRFMFNRGHWKKFELTEDGPRVGARNAKGQPSYGVNDADSTTFATDWLCDRLLDFIDEHSEGPFCYHLSLPDPHGPNTVRAPYDNAFMDSPVRPPMTFSKTAENPKWAPVDNKNGAKRFNAAAMQAYFGMVACIDDNVGRILERLTDRGLLERTILVFTSDHGDLCYEHGRLNKGIPYEASAKVPMLIAAPGMIPEATRIDASWSNVDFAPTILRMLLGDDAETHPALKEMEGIDRTRVLNGSDDATDSISFLRSASDKPGWVAAVTDTHKLVVSVSDVPWLFDLEKDPSELQNNIDDPENASIVQRLTKALLSYGIEHQDPQLQGNSQLVTQLNELLAAE